MQLLQVHAKLATERLQGERLQLQGEQFQGEQLTVAVRDEAAHELVIAEEGDADQDLILNRTGKLQVFRDVEYGPFPRHLGDVFCDDVGGPRPVMIFLHGRGGSKASMGQLASEVAGWGYTTLSIEYAAWTDVIVAASWLRQNRRKYRVDPSWIGVYGFSNGGNLAAKAALQATEGSKLQAAVIVAGSTPQHKALISDNAPPFLLVHSEDDDVVPFRSARELLKEFEEQEVPVRTLFYKSGDHSPHKVNPEQFSAILRRFLAMSIQGLINFVPNLAAPILDSPSTAQKTGTSRGASNEQADADQVTAAANHRNQRAQPSTTTSGSGRVQRSKEQESTTTTTTRRPRSVATTTASTRASPNRRTETTATTTRGSRAVPVETTTASRRSLPNRQQEATTTEARIARPATRTVTTTAATRQARAQSTTAIATGRGARPATSTTASRSSQPNRQQEPTTTSRRPQPNRQQEPTTTKATAPTERQAPRATGTRSR